MSPAGKRHGKIASRFALSLGAHVVAHELGETYAAETGFRLESDPDVVRAPDFAFVRRERVAQIGDIDGYVPGPPDFALEVISPNDPLTQVEEKVNGWLRAGVRVVAVADPIGRRVDLRRSGAETELFAENEELVIRDLFPGWRLRVDELFH